MTYTLFLDDERFPVDESAVICRSFDEAVACVRARGIPDVVLFDHDLGDGPSGHDFAKWLVSNALDGNGFPAHFEVHSQNPVGRHNIIATMDWYYRGRRPKARPENLK